MADGRLSCSRIPLLVPPRPSVRSLCHPFLEATNPDCPKLGETHTLKLGSVVRPDLCEAVNESVLVAGEPEGIHDVAASALAMAARPWVLQAVEDGSVNLRFFSDRYCCRYSIWSTASARESTNSSRESINPSCEFAAWSAKSMSSCV